MITYCPDSMYEGILRSTLPALLINLLTALPTYQITNYKEAVENISSAIAIESVFIDLEPGLSLAAYQAYVIDNDAHPNPVTVVVNASSTFVM